MKRRRPIAALLVAAILSSGCMKLYANYRSTADLHVDNTRLGKKEGRASRHTVLWLVSWGDAGTSAAAGNGGIVTMNHMDSETFQLLYGLYTRKTVVVYGD